MQLSIVQQFTKSKSPQIAECRQIVAPKLGKQSQLDTYLPMDHHPIKACNLAIIGLEIRLVWSIKLRGRSHNIMELGYLYTTSSAKIKF